MADISRRSFLKGFPRLFGRSVLSIPDTARRGLRRRGGGALRLPAPEASLDGIPAVHSWIAIAHTLAESTGSRVPYVLLVGGSGEAFRLAYHRDEPERAIRDCPVNTFLAALAIAGLTGHATQGGPFEPALGGVESTLEKGLAVVVGTRNGPAVVTGVDRKAGEVACSWPAGGAARVPFAAFEAEWREGWWTAGPAPLLRITVERSRRPRPLDDIARVGLETLVTLLSREAIGEGLDAYEDWARDLRESAITPEQADALHGRLLPALGVGRMAGAMFLDAVARGSPPDRREPVRAACRHYREIHNPDPEGGTWGTGLFPEVAQCLLTAGRPDAEKLADPSLRDRAADLLLRIHEEESAALKAVIGT